MSEQEHFLRLAVALLLGMLIGLERGWQEREAAEGSRVAGIRTYALLGLLGGAWAMTAEAFGAVILGFGLIAVTLILATAYWVSTRRDYDLGITGLVASLLAFVFGALAVAGYLALAAAGAVITVLLLGHKPLLHGWLIRLERQELFATFKLLVITLVILPILPDQGYGPWEALNPFRIWWMVILIAGISFVGYMAVRFAGTRSGLALTALVGGLASSTAVTVNFARIARRRHRPELTRALADSALLSCITMFPRMFVIVAVVTPQLAASVLVPMLVTTVAGYGLGGWLWWRGGPVATGRRARSVLYNPLELTPAVLFGLVLAGILILSRGLQQAFGDAGLYALAGAAGLADVAAISLSISELHFAGEILPQVAVVSLFIAAVVNSLVKIVLATAIGGRAMGLRLGLPLVTAMVVGLPLYWLL